MDRRQSRRATGRLAAGALVTAALLATSSCGLFGSDDRHDAAPSTTTTARPTTTTTVAPVPHADPPRLLEAGAEPRQLLRVHYRSGEEATIVLTSDLAVTQTSRGRTQRLDSPPIQQTLTYTVGDVTDQGAALTIRIADVTVKAKGTGLSDDDVAALQKQLDPLVGLETTGTATPLGELEAVSFDEPAGLSAATTARLASLDEQIAALGPSLPVEPVGTGARWQTTSPTDSGGAKGTITTTVTATAIGEHQLAYRSTISVSAGAQDLHLQGVAAGTTARLLSSELSGTSKGTLGLDALGLSLRTTLSGSQKLTLTHAGGQTGLTQRIDLGYVARTDTGG